MRGSLQGIVLRVGVDTRRERSCSVGAAPSGTGGVNSDGNAQGGRRTSPDAPGGARTTSGNLLKQTGRTTGPIGTFTGHYGGPPCTDNC